MPREVRRGGTCTRFIALLHEASTRDHWRLSRERRALVVARMPYRVRGAGAETGLPVRAAIAEPCVLHARRRWNFRYVPGRVRRTCGRRAALCESAQRRRRPAVDDVAGGSCRRASVALDGRRHGRRPATNGVLPTARLAAHAVLRVRRRSSRSQRFAFEPPVAPRLHTASERVVGVHGEPHPQTFNGTAIGNATATGNATAIGYNGARVWPSHLQSELTTTPKKRMHGGCPVEPLSSKPKSDL